METDLPGAGARLDDVFALRDFEPLARDSLGEANYGYYATGAADEVTLTDNLAAWRAYRLQPRVLRDTQCVDLTTTLLDRPVAAPFGIAPVALQGLAHPDGEMATARAAAAAEVPFILSTASSRSLEEVAASVDQDGGQRWFQLYVEHDLGFARELVQRAESAGFHAIVLTVDLPVLGLRERDRRAGFDAPATIQAHLPPAAVESEIGSYLSRASVELSWSDVADIANWSGLPLVLKGILHPEDAQLAAMAGARGIIVSNHGGRQLDSVVTAPERLADVVAAVGDRIEVYADGGIRRGSDVAVALALGARAVFIGRPIVYALAAAGEAGVTHALRLMREEVVRTFALLGVSTPSELGPGHLHGYRAQAW